MHGITPLLISLSSGHTDVIKAFIQSGANVNKTDEFGDTALDYAQLVKHELFLQHRGLHDTEWDITVRTIEESLFKTVDDVSAAKDISNLQSPHSSRRQ